MTTDPPEIRRPPTWAETLAEAKRTAESAQVFEPVPVATRVDTITAPPKPERDPSNLNDPRLQRWVIAFAWLLVLVMLGTCVAGGACLLGAFRDCECEDG